RRDQGGRVDIGADEFDGTTPSFTLRVVRVSPSGNDDHDGSSWELAKRTVQAGINAIAGPGGGDVWVAAGTYTERITLEACVHVYGGFAGTEFRRDQRDWVAHVTILDGNAGGSVVSVPFGSELGTVDGFTIRNGKATKAGGGICCDSSSPTIANNTITGNSVTGLYAPGGGIYCAGGSPAISNNAVTGNSAIGRQAYGGGIYCFGGSPKISNNMITGNIADGTSSSCGGGIYCSGGSPTISNDTITGNALTGTDSDCDGGGIHCHYSSPTITNTIVAFNSSGICASGSGSNLRYNCVYGNTAYNYSGVANPTGTDGNISADPQLVLSPTAGVDGKWGTADDDLGDLHLRAGSPCIDAGDNGAVPPRILTDLGSLPRFFNDPITVDTGLGTAPIVDIGAHEYILGDFDRDGDIDTEDMKTFAACVAGPAVPHAGNCAKADFDKDGDVDQSDFGFLQRCFSGEDRAADTGCGD
ncbi:MAG: DUF1565 domain-containing protein, partial [Phycisphaerae bacterium]|nr:DUF1565 domain-containing protein [Phycisphaerae bacterium]